jgi:RNA polymerase sigma-70 factor (ECF subfamily)
MVLTQPVSYVNAATMPLEQDDLALVARITHHSDYHAFEHLFHKHYNSLCRYAYSYVQAREAAEDIVSEVFLKIWKNREALQIKSSVQSYLIFATRNLAIDQLRRLVRQRGYLENLTDAEVRTDDDSPFDIVSRDETSALIEAAIDQLSPQCRLIFRMSRDKGMSYAEIAANLNLSIKTIEAHIGRSLKLLREAMRQEEIFA